MSNYTIKIDYTTGDSLGTKEASEEIGSFETLEEAKQFLSVLIEHHRFSLKANEIYSKDQYSALIEQYKLKPWFVADRPESTFIYNNRQNRAFYQDCFESLIRASIILTETANTDSLYYPDTYQ
jgi:hypothetical protein